MSAAASTGADRNGTGRNGAGADRTTGNRTGRATGGRADRTAGNDPSENGERANGDNGDRAQARTPERWYPSLPTPPEVRPISLTGPSWSDRLDTYRAWPRWARTVAAATAVVVVLGVGALGMAAGRDDDGDSLTTSGEGHGAPFGTDGTGGDVTGSSAGPTPTSTSPTTAAPPTSASGPGTSAPSDGGATADDGQSGQPDAPPEGQSPHGDPDGEHGSSPNADDPGTGDQCHPSYTDCVPVADDVDCEGRGDGPVYVGGHQQVVGPDVYGLDPDANGRTCD